MKHFVYIVECRDGTLYTGWTTNLERRIRAHNSGSGAKYTRSRRPVKLVCFECFETKEEALRREYAIKQLSRQQKRELIAHFSETASYLDSPYNKLQWMGEEYLMQELKNQRK